MEKLLNDFSYGLFFWQLVILAILIVLLGKICLETNFEFSYCKEKMRN